MIFFSLIFITFLHPSFQQITIKLNTSAYFDIETEVHFNSELFYPLAEDKLTTSKDEITTTSPFNSLETVENSFFTNSTIDLLHIHNGLLFARDKNNNETIVHSCEVHSDVSFGKTQKIVENCQKYFTVPKDIAILEVFQHNVKSDVYIVGQKSDTKALFLMYKFQEIQETKSILCSTLKIEKPSVFVDQLSNSEDLVLTGYTVDFNGLDRLVYIKIKSLIDEKLANSSLNCEGKIQSRLNTPQNTIFGFSLIPMDPSSNGWKGQVAYLKIDNITPEYLLKDALYSQASNQNNNNQVTQIQTGILSQQADKMDFCATIGDSRLIMDQKAKKIFLIDYQKIKIDEITIRIGTIFTSWLKCSINGEYAAYASIYTVGVDAAKTGRIVVNVIKLKSQKTGVTMDNTFYQKTIIIDNENLGLLDRIKDDYDLFTIDNNKVTIKYSDFQNNKNLHYEILNFSTFRMFKKFKNEQFTISNDYSTYIESVNLRTYTQSITIINSNTQEQTQSNITENSLLSRSGFEFETNHTITGHIWDSYISEGPQVNQTFILKGRVELIENSTIGWNLESQNGGYLISDFVDSGKFVLSLLVRVCREACYIKIGKSMRGFHGWMEYSDGQTSKEKLNFIPKIAKIDSFHSQVNNTEQSVSVAFLVKTAYNTTSLYFGNLKVIFSNVAKPKITQDLDIKYNLVNLPGDFKYLALGCREGSCIASMYSHVSKLIPPRIYVINQQNGELSTELQIKSTYNFDIQYTINNDKIFSLYADMQSSSFYINEVTILQGVNFLSL